MARHAACGEVLKGVAKENVHKFGHVKVDDDEPTNIESVNKKTFDVVIGKNVLDEGDLELKDDHTPNARLVSSACCFSLRLHRQLKRAHPSSAFPIVVHTWAVEEPLKSKWKDCVPSRASVETPPADAGRRASKKSAKGKGGKSAGKGRASGRATGESRVKRKIAPPL